jgi:hypothetical protein
LRIRILRPLTGVIDGVPLGQFELGGTYDVTDSLGAFLVAGHSAEEAFSPRLRRTMDEDGGFPSSMLEGGVSVSGPPTKPN